MCRNGCLEVRFPCCSLYTRDKEKRMHFLFAYTFFHRRDAETQRKTGRWKSSIAEMHPNQKAAAQILGKKIRPPSASDTVMLHRRDAETQRKTGRWKSSLPNASNQKAEAQTLGK